MLKRSFIGLMKPWIKYELLLDAPQEIPSVALPDQATLFIDAPFEQKGSGLNPGDSIKTGQLVAVGAAEQGAAVSPLTGKVTAMAAYTGDFGRKVTAVSVDVAADDYDEAFGASVDEPSLATAIKYLSDVPGKPPLETFENQDLAIDTIVICGVDNELLVGTNQWVLLNRLGDIDRGAQILRKITGVERIILAIPRELMQGFGHLHLEPVAIDTDYPAANPHLIMKRVLDIEVPAGKTCQEMGTVFFSAEAVASIGRAYQNGRVPVTKTLTVIDKAGVGHLMKARLGTPFGQLLSGCNIETGDMDQVIIGGPMRGRAIYSLDDPVEADTDAIMVQDRVEVARSSDYPCINCGDCNRICPADIPIDMLVRVLEAGLYEQAADEYDLNSCIECGLCSAVCVSKIPIFQYIRLGKYELKRTQMVEAANE